MIASRTRLFNQLQCILASFFPEFLQVMKDVKTASARHLLKKYPVPHNIVTLGLPALTAELRKVSRGKLKEDRARELFEASNESVGINAGRGSGLPVILRFKSGCCLQFLSSSTRRLYKQKICISTVATHL